MDIITELASHSALESSLHDFYAKAQDRPYLSFIRPAQREIDLNWISVNESLVLKDITRQLKKRKYFPDHTTRNLVQLDKQRLIYSQTWPDRIICSALEKLIQSQLEKYYSDNLFSFRKGRGHHLAIQRVCDYLQQQECESLYIFRTDITAYGEHIDRSLLLQTYEKYLPPQEPYFWTLLKQFLEPTHRDSDGKVHQPDKRGIPHGLPICNSATNIYLTPMDTLLDNDGDTFYLRYGDDILLLGASEKAFEEKKAYILSELSTRGLTLSAHKTTDATLTNEDITSPQNGRKRLKQFQYCGMSITRDSRIFLSKDNLDLFKKEYRRAAHFAFHTIRRETREREVQIQYMIQSMNKHLRRSLLSTKTMKIIQHTNNRKAVQQLDKWMAKQILKPIFRTAHDRVFRYCSYNSLIERGHHSLRAAIDSFPRAAC